MAFDPNQYKVNPISFNPNQYKQTAQQMFGQNAFDFSNVQKTVQMQAQAEAMRKQVLNLYQQRLHPPKPKVPKVEKKTYQDAVNYISANKDQFLNPANWNGKSGAYQVANEIRNNPAKQAELKAQGYNVNDFINALYAGLSDGNYRSEREYKQNVSQMNKVNADKIKAYQAKHGMTPDQAYQLQKQSQQKQPTKSNGNWFTNALDTIEKPLHGFMNTLNEAVKQGEYNAKHYKPGQQPSQSLRKIAKDFKKGTHTQTSGADVVKTLGVKNKTAQNAIGSSADLFLDPVNLIGLGVASKGAKLLNVAGKVEKGAKALGAGDKLAKLAGISAKGGTITGGASAIQQGADALAHPGTQSLKQRLENVGFNTAIGAIGDPLLHVGGSKIANFFGKDTVAKSELDKALINPNTPNDVKQEILALPEPKMINQPINDTTTMKVPLQYVGNIKNPIALRAERNPNVINQFRSKLNPNQEVTATKQFENISPDGGNLHKLTKAEQSHMKNIDTFAQNNNVNAIPDTSSHIMSKKDVKQSPSGLLDKAQVKIVDNLKPLDWFDKTVEKVTGQKLRPSESSYTLGLNSRGSDMVSKQILTKNMVNSKGDVIGKSLKDVTSNLTPQKLKSFEDYLVNKHAITRMNRGEKVFPDQMKMSPQKSEQIVKAYEQKFPEFKQLSQEYYNYNKQLGKAWLVDTGILSQKDWEGYLKANPNYVPNNRIFQSIERHMNQSAKRGFANQSNPIKKAVGSQRKIVSPIESTIEHTAQYVKTAKRNEVIQALIKNIQKDPEAFKGWAEIVNTEKAPIQDTLQKEGIGGVLENINKGFDQKPDLTKGNIVTGIIDGQKVHVKVDDPQLLEALTNLNPKQQHFVVRLVGQMTRVMKNLTTGINPVFSLTRNVFRDIPQSYSNSKSVDSPAKFAKDLVSAFMDVLGNREAYQSFKNFGGGHSSPISSDVNLLAQSKRAILAPKNGVFATPKRVGGKLLGGLENLNNAIESAPRLAEFKRISKNGSYDSKVKALFEANDITTNFNKYGDTTKFLDAFVPYLNAAVQGLDKLGRQFVADGAKGAIRTGVKASAAVTLPAIVLYAINHDNPNYQQLSNYIKDQNFLIPTGNGQFIKIPKPRELGVMFGSDVERVLRAWADNDPHAFDGFTQYVKQMFWPPTRPITAPLSDIRANKNFMGTPIVPGDLQNLSPKYQYDAQTSEVAKKLGGIFNQSPKNIDYLFKSYGGVLGQLGIPATTKNSTVGDTLKKQVTADPVFSNDILSNFYDEKAKLDTAHNDFKKQGVRTKDFNESLRSVFDSRANAISDLRKRMKQALNNDSLTLQQREQQVRQIQQQINAIAKQTNQLVR